VLLGTYFGVPNNIIKVGCVVPNNAAIQLKIICVHLRVGLGKVCFISISSLIFYMYACYFSSTLLVYWTCRMFSKPWDWSWCTQADPDTYINNNKKIICVFYPISLVSSAKTFPRSPEFLLQFTIISPSIKFFYVIFFYQNSLFIHSF